jgi:hypothetical protein
LDEVSDPIILAYQLGRKDKTTWRQHVKPAADFLVNFVSWAHAQFIRLAFDIAAGGLLEQPVIVARRYLQHRSGDPAAKD